MNRLLSHDRSACHQPTATLSPMAPPPRYVYSRRLLPTALFIASLISFYAHEVAAQYAIGHRTFGAGTSMGIGLSRQSLDFTHINDSKFSYLLPTLELKLFLSDGLSLDLSVPVTNIATCNALCGYFRVTGEAYLNFHPSAPSPVELFAAPGLGFSYSMDSYKDDAGKRIKEEAWAFHIPVRLGVELNSVLRGFSTIVAFRPFFTLMHGASGDVHAGGGGLVEIGFMGYATRFRADRY